MTQPAPDPTGNPFPPKNQPVPCVDEQEPMQPLPSDDEPVEDE